MTCQCILGRDNAHDRNQPRKYRTDGDPIVKFITRDVWEITLTIKEVLI